MDGLNLHSATTIFLIANIVISVTGFANENFVRWGLLNVNAVLKHNEWHRLLTAGFLHADPMHLFVNMLTLFFFGPYMEYPSTLGPQTFFIVYLGALVIGNLGALLVHANEPRYSALGASGAVSGVLFAFCLFAPFTNIYVFGALPVPAILYAFLFVAYSLYGMKAQNDNIGHDAHLFGAIGGVVLTIILKPEALSRFMGQISGLFG